jgi:hypothetical protein
MHVPPRITSKIRRIKNYNENSTGNRYLCLFYFIIGYFIYLHIKCCPPSGFPSANPRSPPPSPLLLGGCSSTCSPTPTSPPWHSSELVGGLVPGSSGGIYIYPHFMLSLKRGVGLGKWPRTCYKPDDLSLAARTRLVNGESQSLTDFVPCPSHVHYGLSSHSIYLKYPCKYNLKVTD